MFKKLFIATILVFFISLTLTSSEITNTKIIKKYSDEKLIEIEKHYKSVISKSKSINFRNKSSIESESFLKISIFPNPVKDNINIITDIEINKIEIFNGTGVKVKTISYSEVSSELSIEFNNHPKGLYFINFYLNGNLVRSEMFVK